MNDNPGDEGYESNDLFPADITTPIQMGGTYYYPWKEQSYDTRTGVYSDSYCGRNGTNLVEINNQLVATPSFVWVRMRGVVNNQPLYEFDAGVALSGATSSSNSNTAVEILTDAECDSGGLSVTFKALSGYVSIGGIQYPVHFNLA